MEKILKGLKKFQEEVYPEHKDRFEALAQSQDPDVLFITCSDSRIDPNLITQSEPGELFICRNAGNIVPPHSHETGGMTASIEYAVSVLKVRHIIICGHSSCGAMKAAMNPLSVKRLPHVKVWLDHCRAAKEAVQLEHEHLADEHLDEVTKQNIILQMNHLKTHPAVFSKLHTNEIQVHGWMYDIKTGNVEIYDDKQTRFIHI
ncbi:carbonic anhydrase [Psychrosphaera sp.]|nr:carbonic anhydrase [Psychrosphaera sp.]